MLYFVKTLYIEPDSPWQHGRVESFHGSLLVPVAHGYMLFFR